MLVVCNVCVCDTAIFSAGVWKLGCRAQVQAPPVSYIQYHKTLGHYKSRNPSVSGLFTFFLFSVDRLQTVAHRVGEVITFANDMSLFSPKKHQTNKNKKKTN